ncbi:MAG: phosphonate C-P lyase system protein PhnG [Burkholderiaceae bacterium]|nr:phosphonate C-P lyase system protein PhnG [Burkholderiaceae bacterium]
MLVISASCAGPSIAAPWWLSRPLIWNSEDISPVLHAVDKNDPSPADRKHWLALLARATTERLEQALRPWSMLNAVFLRPPESGLMMVRARVGGSGERFNLGEMTVTRCALRVTERGTTTAGVAYVMGRSARQAELAARADALLQMPAHAATLQRQLIEPLTAERAQRAEQAERRAQATRVEFFTVARESSQ